MGEVFGYELVAQALKNEGADTMFFIMGGPMLGAQDTCRKLAPSVNIVRSSLARYLKKEHLLRHDPARLAQVILDL